MRKTWNLIQKLGRDEEGAALIEYTVLLGIMLVAVIASIIFVGGWVQGRWVALSGALPANP
jgi:pilus assembly protein Flp/PilA